MKLKYYIAFLLFILSFLKGKSQNSTSNNGGGFELKVRIYDTENREYIKNAEVSINALFITRSDINGFYRVKAKLNDELVVRHPDFETVRRTINSNDDIIIKVIGNVNYNKSKRSRTSLDRLKSTFKSEKKFTKNYTQIIDSALFYKEKDLDKSISFIEEALETNNSKQRNANTYKVLGDIYFFWKQYDIAISDYKISLQIYDKLETRLQLAKAQFLAKKYEDSENTYKQIENKNLSSYDKVKVFEGLGDALLFQEKYKEAKQFYKKGVDLAREKSISDVTLDINTRLANIYAKEGKLNEANTTINITLKEASELPKKPALKVQKEVADFYNETRQYDNEIKLRKELLKIVDEVNKNSTDSIKYKYDYDGFLNFNSNNLENKEDEENKDSLTSQKLNYKIGNAYVLKENYIEAIEYLEKSVEEAGQKEDLEVQKHATRKLSEVYATVGQHVKAIQTYRNYVDIVDSLYIRKEQEIYQAQRLTKKISDYQSRLTVLERNTQLSDSKVSLAIKEEQLTKAKSKTQLIIIYSLVGSLALMTLLASYKHRANQKQQLANNLLALKSMRSQMNPHFIFNALNSVNSFIAVNDERNANRYLSEFSALMRAVLENSDEDFIPFQKEIELLELYVKLEHNRFRDKFDYIIDVDQSINLEEFKIPPMLLQPYIENAIWHGLRYKKEKGNLRISINKKTEDTITIVIEDDGIGRKKSLEMKTKNQLKQKSKGMSTIKNRIDILNDMYQDKVDVTITDLLEDGSGTRVELTLKK